MGTKKDRRIFIHIPKNGGMTIRRAPQLRNRIIIAGRKHHKSEEYSDAVLNTMNKYGQHHGYEHARWRDVAPELTANHSAFAIIRNPWSKVVSRYTFAVLLAQRGTISLPQHYTIEQFLEERHTWGNVPYFWHRAILGWYPQYQHVTDEEGNLRCDILRMEYFTEDTMKYFNLKGPLEIRNVSNGDRVDDNKQLTNKKDYREFFNDTTREIVADWYKDDIEFFGFTFDGPATKNIWNTDESVCNRITK